MTDPVDPVAITRDLVARQSYVSRGIDEVDVAEYIESFLRTMTPFELTRQNVEGRRFNVLARSDGGPIELLLAGHMDTVQPKHGWTRERDQFAGVVEDGLLYGLGSLDMKSGIAAILAAAASICDAPHGLALLFYCDEEYDFRGMRAFVGGSPDLLPKRCVITEPTNLKIRNQQRGIVEVDIAVTGTTGHASNPGDTTSAIDGLHTVVQHLRRWLTRFAAPLLGEPTVNISFFRGGLRPADPKTSPRWTLGRQGNNVADWAEAVIEVRTTSEECRAGPIVDYLRSQVHELGLGLDSLSLHHDLASMNVGREELAFVEHGLDRAGFGAEYTGEPGRLGYSDCAMVRSAWNIPVATLGPVGHGMHAVDECVDVVSIARLQEAIGGLIDVCCGSPVG